MTETLLERLARLRKDERWADLLAIYRLPATILDDPAPAIRDQAFEEAAAKAREVAEACGNRAMAKTALAIERLIRALKGTPPSPTEREIADDLAEAASRWRQQACEQEAVLKELVEALEKIAEPEADVGSATMRNIARVALLKVQQTGGGQ